MTDNNSSSSINEAIKRHIDNRYEGFYLKIFIKKNHSIFSKQFKVKIVYLFIHRINIFF